MLYEILSQGKDIWTIGDESHQAIESIPELQIAKNDYTNRLTRANATESVSIQLQRNFYRNLVNRDGMTIPADVDNIRFLEKTPKNSLRIPFLNSVFPDAYFVYLVRDPSETISSIIEAWNNGRWVTYHGLPNWDINWSLLLPPDWASMKNKSIADIAAFQWKAANNYIINDLQNIPRNRWTIISYDELIKETSAHVNNICRFCEIEFDSHLKGITQERLALSRYTLTPPDRNKWKKNEDEITKIFPTIQKTINSINSIIKTNRGARIPWNINKVQTAISKNSPCHCGSGKKYKRCHGA